MDIKNKSSRLKRFYGDVAKDQNSSIVSLITGESILDIGCGYGTLIDQIRRSYPSKKVVGIDLDDDSIRMAKKIYDIEIKTMSAYKMDFPDNSFDTVILRETIHHFDSDEKLKLALREIHRVSSREVIIFDPNPNWVVKFSRILIKHKDPEAPLNKVIDEVKAAGFRVELCRWRDVMAFPLSGGFVGPELVPNIKIVKKAVMAIDRVMDKLLSLLRLQRYFCWRYLLRAVKV